MGRNKIKIEKIENTKIRQVTFYKRKRGLLKKAMELSLLCESKIFLCIVDKIEKFTIYCSESNINNFLATYIQKINENKIQCKDIVSNNDYRTLFNIRLACDQTELNIEGQNNNSDLQGSEIDFNSCNATSKSRINTIHENNIFDDKNRTENKLQYIIHPSEYVNSGLMNNHSLDNDLNLFISSNEYGYKDIYDYNIIEKKKNSKEDPNKESANLLNNLKSIFTMTDDDSNIKDISKIAYSRKTSSKPHHIIPKNDINYNKCENITNYYADLNSNKKTCKLTRKRGREETSIHPNSSTNELNSNIDNFLFYNNKINPNFNMTNINSDNLANLQTIFPNLNFISQNMGIINWVVPGEIIKNQDSKNDEKSEKL